MSRKYEGKRAQDNRARARALLPTACHYCGNVVDASMKWEADHPIPRAEAEALGISELEQDLGVLPVHASCNHKAGARLGNQLRAAQRAQPRVIVRVNRCVSFLDPASEPRQAAPNVPRPIGSDDDGEAL